MNLVLLDPHEVTPQGATVLNDHRAQHLREVLKVTAGDTVRIGITDGAVGVGTVTALAGSSVTLACEFGDVPDPPKVDLLLALPRPKVLRRLWAQLAAIGVGRIMLTNAERVERNYFDTHVLAPASYRPLLREGLQQARDTHVPQVTIHRRFRVLVEDELDTLVPSATRIVAHPDDSSPIATVVDRGRGPRLLLAVGPEGGWNPFELSLLEAHGFRRVSMGTRTLRTDTACISLLALARQAIGDL